MCALVLALPACAGDDQPPAGEAPKPVLGGGTSGGALAGVLDVFVVEAGTNRPVAGASVYLGGADAALAGLSDENGHLRAAAPSGKLDVSAAQSGFVPSLWVGVDKASVTLPLEPSASTPGVATLSGSVQGWQSLPDPAPGHYRHLAVEYTKQKQLFAPDNALPQPLGSNGQPKNVCRRAPGESAACSFELTARTGPVSLYAVVVEGDDNGTPADPSDDKTSISGLAFLPQIELSAGQTLGGLELTLLDASQLGSASVNTPMLPAELNTVIGVPGVSLASGVILYPAVSDNVYPVPVASGDFAGAALWGVATASDGINLRLSVAITRGIEPPAAGASLTIDLPPLFDPPTLRLLNPGFELLVPDASNLVLGELGDTAGKRFDVVLLDPRAPVLLPAALGSSAGLQLDFLALEVPAGGALGLDAARAEMTRAASNKIPLPP